MSTTKPERNELKRVDSYQWPSGHVGHLTSGQQAALEKFKELCKAKAYYDPGDETRPPTHDDETLLRYLRARKFIPQDAFGQLKDTEDWRLANSIEQLYETIDVNEYEQTRVLYPQWTGRRDKRGIPFYVFEVGHLDAKDVTAYQEDKDRKSSKTSGSVKAKVPRKMLRLFALYENLCRFVLPLCSAMPDRPNHETPVSQSNNIVDISKVGLKQFWTLRAHLQDASKLATAHYPETLDRIFIVGAPSFFPTIWDWAKKWFDPITVSKIFILNNANMKSTLEKYIEVDDLPKKYGGNLDWAFGDMPALEPAIADALQWKEDIRQKGHRTLPIGPIKWQYDQDENLVAVAIGTENGSKRHRVLASLHPEVGVARLALSPGRVGNNNNNNNNIDAAAANSTAVPAAKAAPTDHKVPNGAPNGSAQPQPMTTPPSAGGIPPPPAEAPTDTDAFSVPYRDPSNAVHAPPPDGRQGTSASRYEQQAATHAHGAMHHGTPAVQTDGQGVEHAVMEPRTVGQAPKDTPLYRDAGGDEQQPGMLEQAQAAAGSLAGQAAALSERVAGAVGLGGGGAEEKKVEEEGEGAAKAQSDPQVDGMQPKIVEEYLRAQNMSKPGDQKTE